MNPEYYAQLLEHALFAIAAVGLTAAAVYIAYGVFLRKSLRPRYVWLYVGAVVTATAVWRWLVFSLYGFDTDNLSYLAELLLPWINPVSATLYTLNGMSALLLAYAGSRRRRGDGR